MYEQLRDSGSTWDSNYSTWCSSSGGDLRASLISTNTDYSLLSQPSIPSGPSPTFQNYARYPTLGVPTLQTAHAPGRTPGTQPSPVFGPAPPSTSPSSSASVLDKKASNIYVCPHCGDTFGRGPDLRTHFKATCIGLGAGCEAWECSCCTHLARNEFQAQKHQKTHSPQHQGPSYARTTSLQQGQSTCCKAWACSCCNHLAETERQAQVHQETHGPLHQGPSYARLSLPPKERFACCYHPRIFRNLKEFLDHLTKDCNLRTCPTEADHRWRLRTLLQDGKDQSQNGNQHSYIHAAVLQWCRSHGLPEDAWTQAVDVSSSAAAKDIADRLERGLVPRESENYALLSRLGFTSVHETVDRILLPLLSLRHGRTSPDANDVRARSGQMQPQLQGPQRSYPLPNGETGIAPQQRLQSQAVQKHRWQQPLQGPVRQQPLHQAQPSQVGGYLAPSHQTRPVHPCPLRQDSLLPGQRRPTGPLPRSVSLADTAPTLDQAQGWLSPDRYGPIHVQGAQVYAPPSYGNQASPNAYGIYGAPFYGSDFASHATYATPPNPAISTAIDVDRDVERNTNSSGPEDTGAWLQVSQNIESGAADVLTFRGPWPMQPQKQAPRHAHRKNTVMQYGLSTANGRHALLSTVQEATSEDLPNAARASMLLIADPHKEGVAAKSVGARKHEKRSVSRLSLASQVLPESLARREVLRNQRDVSSRHPGADQRGKALDPILSAPKERSSRKQSDADNLFSYDALFGPDEDTQAPSTLNPGQCQHPTNSVYLPTVPLPPVPVSPRLTPPIDRPRTPKDKIKDFFNRSSGNDKVLELQDVDPVLIFGTRPPAHIELHGPAGDQRLQLSCSQCGQGVFASQDVLAAHTATLHPPAPTPMREKRRGRIFP